MTSALEATTDAVVTVARESNPRVDVAAAIGSNPIARQRGKADDHAPRPGQQYRSAKRETPSCKPNIRFLHRSAL
jgi:hypothetical protein